MSAVTALAIKDLRLLARDRGGLFFVLGWPLIVAVLFGLVFGGGGGGNSKPRVAVVDQDASEASRDFQRRLQALTELDVDVATDAQAGRELVRTGKRTAVVVIPAGFGQLSGNLFFGETASVQVVVDPSRKAEQAMLSGMLQRLAGERMVGMMSAPRGSAWLARAREQVNGLPGDERESLTRLFDSLEAVPDLSRIAPGNSGASGQDEASASWSPMRVEFQSVERQRAGPKNSFALTFPQGLLWGMIGCLMSFATSLVLERMQGTLLRLYASPMSPGMILLGKGLACFIAIAVLGVLMMGLAVVVFGVRPTSWPLLGLALLACAFAFTGMMMLIAGLGRSPQAVSGAGWAALLPLMLFGGGMVPSFAMPAWMSAVGNFSPMHWASLALEGALWRDFSFVEMVPALAVLLGVGALCLVIGARRLNHRAAYL